MKEDMMTQAAGEMLRSLGAVLHGHFLLSSGLHSPVYIEKFQLVQRPEITVELCRSIAERFAGESVATVAGPTTGGAILAFEVARQLGTRSIFAERSATGGREFRRGFTLET
ncbi:MAG: orotate phosphoribosyltransferase, partial [Chloroflexota bacterium]|nr:orotate phosphoribosyltransferase [Chloroflexota bacterium]